MSKKKLEELEKAYKEKVSECTNLRKQYFEAKIKEEYGEYLNKFTICHLSDDHFPIGDRYMYITKIEYSPIKAKHIIVRGVGFDEHLTYENEEMENIKSINFSFDVNSSIDIFNDDLEIEVISEQEWREKYTEYVGRLTSYINEMKF